MVRPEGRSSNWESASASDARLRFLVPDCDFERKESREGGESEGPGEVEGSRDSVGIEQRRDSFLSEQAGRFLIW